MPSPPAGCSGTPLPKKLGIEPGQRVAFINAPADFGETLGPLPDDVVLVDPGLDAQTVADADDAADALDLVVCFLTSADALHRLIPAWKRRMAPAGMLWIGWPKKASGVKTDVTEDAVRAVALENGLVDTKVCAIDAVWSGLKLVHRLADRPGR